MKKGLIYFNFIIGVLTLWLFVDHVAGFLPHDYFYNQNPTLTLYAGVNIVSRWADFAFFTYHTLLFYAVWAIGLFIAYAFKIERLTSFFTHQTVVVFVLTNYVLTAIVYTLFELASGKPTFGLYDLSNKAIHNFGTNVLAHYVFLIVALIVGLKIKTQGEIKRKHIVVIFVYLVLYCIAVKITGMFCYKIEWYPYPIFHGDLLLDMLGIISYDSGIKIACIFMAFAILAVTYFVIFFVLSKIKKHIKYIYTL